MADGGGFSHMADGGGFSRQGGTQTTPRRGRKPPKRRSQGPGLFGAAAELKKKGGGGWSPWTWDFAETVLRATPAGAAATAIEKAARDPSFGSIARAVGAAGTGGMSEVVTVPLGQSARNVATGNAGWGDAIMLGSIFPWGKPLKLASLVRPGARAARVASKAEIAKGQRSPAPVPPGHVRFYRGEGDRTSAVGAPDENTGRWFTRNLKNTRFYGRRVFYVDIPEGEVLRLQGGRHPEGFRVLSAGAEADEWLLPRSLADKAQPLMRGKKPPTPAQEVIGATKGARKIYAEQETLRSAERGKRIGRAVAAYEEAGGGRAGQAAAKAELKGKLPAVPFNELTHLDEAGMRKLTDAVDASDLLGFEQIALRDALYGLKDGKVTRPFENRLIERVFGPEAAAEASSLGLIAKVGRGIAEVVNIPRALETTLDVSFVARQALVMLAHNPKLVAKNLPTMFRAMGSEKYYQDFHRALVAHPKYEYWRSMGVRFTDLGKKLGAREEPFQSNLAEKITAAGFKGVGAGHGPVRASNRAFTTMSNALRFSGAEKMADDFGEAWLAAGGSEAELGQGIAKFVNWATGRGGLGKFEGAAVPLNAVFFAPRLFTSRVQTFNPQFYASLPKPVRIAAMKATFKLVSGGTTILGLAALGGARVGLDPRSADFGKIRVGNTRYDLWGGHQQIAKLVAQLAKGEIISSTTGKKMSLRGGYGALNRMDITYRFGESKFAPPASLVKDLFKGTDFAGKPFSWKKQAAARMLPLLIQDAVEVYQETGSPLETGLAYGVGSVGVGVQNYGPRAKEKRSRLRPTSRPKPARNRAGGFSRGTGGGFSK